MALLPTSLPRSRRRAGAATGAAVTRARGWRGGGSLLWRIFFANAAVLAAAALALVLTPMTISTNVALAEVVIVAAGLAAMLTADLVLLRRTLRPLLRLTRMMARVDGADPAIAAGGSAVPGRADDEVRALTDAFEAMLERLEVERRRTARRALAAQEDERSRIARELHDEIGQMLTAITIRAERAASCAAPADRPALEEIAATALAGLEDVRRIARELRPEALDDLGLVNALITLCTRVSEGSGIPVARRLESPLPGLSEEVELVIYRVAQEAITNAVRHAGASRITVTLEPRGPDRLRLEVSDDGAGLAAARLAAGGSGLAGMRERALLVGGDLEVRTAPGAGTTIVLETPEVPAP